MSLPVISCWFRDMSFYFLKIHKIATHGKKNATITIP